MSQPPQQPHASLGSPRQSLMSWWCRLGLHTWTNWSLPHRSNFFIPKYDRHIELERQSRTCIKCYKQEMREPA